MSDQPRHELGPVLAADRELTCEIRSRVGGGFMVAIWRIGRLAAMGSADTTFAAVDAALDALEEDRP